MSERKLSQVSYRDLWAQFFPLALSDVTMALGDPLVNVTLAHLPEARVSLAAMGIAKSQAVFFESPIIMLLHASNALAEKMGARQALYQFTFILTAFLTLLCAVFCWDPVFQKIAVDTMGVAPELAQNARRALSILILWPAVIGWRRVFQGLLIHHGFGSAIGRASLARAVALASLLYLGFQIQLDPVTLAAGATMIGLLCELAFVVRSAAIHDLIWIPDNSGPKMSLCALFKFYWPLGNSMIVVWGGRALLTAVVAQAADGSLALAAWPAVWGVVLLIANSTRMVQQITIRHRHHLESKRLLLFAGSVGLVFTFVLAAIGYGPMSKSWLHFFIGNDSELYLSALPVLQICILIPLMVALQNCLQGLLIGDHRTNWVNMATWLGTTTLLITSFYMIKSGFPGATSAAVAMSSAIFVELTWLAYGYWSLIESRVR